MHTPPELSAVIERLTRTDMTQSELIVQLIATITTLKARNVALIRSISDMALRESHGATTVVTLGTGADAVTVVTWSDEEGLLRQVVL